jgi:hypothetical protein
VLGQTAGGLDRFGCALPLWPFASLEQARIRRMQDLDRVPELVGNVWPLAAPVYEDAGERPPETSGPLAGIESSTEALTRRLSRSSVTGPGPRLGRVKGAI